jgi:hypothetical protein
VREYRQEEGLAEIEVKNRITTGDRIEIVSPDRVFSQTVEAIYDLEGQPITVAHPGHKNILLATKQPVEPMMLLRICVQSE